MKWGPRMQRLNKDGDVRSANSFKSTVRAVCFTVAIIAAPLMGGSVAMAQDGSFAPRLYVNDHAISNFEVQQRTLFLQLLRAPGDAEEAAIKGLIEDRLRSSVAKQQGLTLTAETVIAGMNEFASRANLTGDQFIQALGQGGVAPETFRDFVSAGLIWRDVVRAKYAGTVTISEAEIDRAIARSKQATTARLLLSEIVIPGSEGLAIEEKLKREKATGTAFTAAAKRYSKAPSAENGGALDWLPLANLPSEVRDAVIGLEKGQISDPVRVPGGLAVFLLRDIAQDPTEELAPISVKYAEFLVPNDGASAALLRAKVDVCDDLYPIAKGLPEDRLKVETLPIGQVPGAVGAELAKLDPGESSTAITRGQWQVFLMLCSRTPVQELPVQRDDVRTQLINARLGGLAERYLSELKADAIIRQP
jgi:peptidyl-prolyl cis-trans isomerase SurA